MEDILVYLEQRKVLGKDPEAVSTGYWKRGREQWPSGQGTQHLHGYRGRMYSGKSEPLDTAEGVAASLCSIFPQPPGLVMN